MRAILKKLAGVVMALMVAFVPVMPVVMSSGGVWARHEMSAGTAGGGSTSAGDPPEQGKEEGSTPGAGTSTTEGSSTPNTSILPSDWDIEKILKLVLNIIVYGLGVAAVVGVVIAGIMYMTARDNEAQMAKAKTRLIGIAIGLVAWAVMFAVLNWLIPGGLNLS